MSLRAMAWAWEQETKSSGERLVLLALADHAGEDGECWPQSARLGVKCSLDRKTVQRHLTALDERGLITKVSRRQRSNGTLAGWTYRLHIDQPEGTPATPLSEGVGDPSERGHGRPVLEGTPVPSQEPSIKNRQLEPSMNDGWDEFWALYPRKTGKQAAEKAWKKLSGADKQQASASLTRHIAYWQNTETSAQFIPHPATWLNGRRWEDQLPDCKKRGKEAPGMSMVRRMLNEARDG